jgi:outer membrane protein TolC
MFFALLAAILRVGAVSAATPALSLEQALSEAKEHSPRLQRAQGAYDESRWRRIEALGNGFLPRVSATGTHYFYKKYVFTDIPFNGTVVSFPGIYPTTVLSLDASIPVFDGLSNVDRLQAATLSQDASESELSNVDFQVSQETKLAFYQSLAATHLSAVADQNVVTLEDHLKVAEAMKRAGAATDYDVLRVQVQLGDARSDSIDARDNVTLARRKLTQALGLENDDRPLVGELPTPRATLLESLMYNGKPADRADLRALDLRAEAADKAHSAESKWLVPAVSLTGQYLFYNNKNELVADTSSFRDAYSFGILLRWNLFDAAISMARSGQAAYQRTQAEKTSEEASLQAPYDFDLWKRRYLSNAARFDTKTLDLERSRESVRLAREELRAGTRTNSEVLDAELDLFRARAGIVNAQYNAAEALIRLELALGRRI